MRSRRPLLGLATVLLAMLSAAPASAEKPPQVLSGFGDFSPVADAGEASTINVVVTFTALHASGRLQTRHLTTSQPFGKHRGFEGSVTCVLDKGSRIVIGAVGSAFSEREFFNEATNEVELEKTFDPEPHFQVAVVEFGSFPNGLNTATVPRAWGSLGDFEEGELGSTPPDCHAFKSLKAIEPEESGTLRLSPTVFKPKQGAKTKLTTITLAGTGEPNSTLKVHDTMAAKSATKIVVPTTGKWSLTVAGLALGAHEYVFEPTNGGSAVPAHVAFTVSP
jgi:hypothetical protein